MGLDVMWGRGYLYLSKQHWYSFKAGIGEGTNNFAELSAIRLLLRMDAEHKVRNFQIFGDSQITIKRISSQNMIHNVRLVLLLEQVHRLIDSLEKVEIKHIYKEQNALVDELANDGAQMQEGTWFIIEHKNSITNGSLYVLN